MAKTLSAPQSTHPVVRPQSTSSASDIDRAYYQRNLFFRMALDMSWQLAVVVLLPIVGGVKLDEHFKTAPWITIAGALLAMAGIAGVMLRIVKLASVKVTEGPGTEAHQAKQAKKGTK